jgi:chemotaxis protein histidine kinase CheA
MSDAQGKNDPATGEPIEERAAEAPAETQAPETQAPEAPVTETRAAEAPVAEAPVDERPSALADAIGEDPDVTGEGARPAAAEQAEPAASQAEPVTEQGPAAEAPSEPVAEAPTRSARRSAGEPDAPSDPVEPAPARAGAAEPAAAEPTDAEPAARPAPDYAALAAELDALDARHGTEGAEPAPRREAGTASSGSPWFERADETQTFRATEPEGAPAVTASEPAAETVAAPAPQPVFVEAPEPPTKRGNRGAAGLIGLLAAVVFAVLYFAAVAGYTALTDGFASVDELSTFALETVASVTFWIPVVAFFLGFWLLGAIVNRARWGAWVLLGFFVAVLTYAAQVFAPVIAGPFWMITPSEAADVVQEGVLAPLAIAAFVIAREVTIWFGAWAARRGAKMNRLNAEAQEEYARTLEAGPSA